jgi:uncharacterized membrane protein
LTVLLVLVSAFLHASWNALLRLEQDKDRALVAAVGAGAVLSLAVAGVRWGLGDTPFASAEAFGWTVLAGVLEVAYFTSLARALEAGPLGPVYTISRGGAILVVWPLSIALFGELVTASSIAGSAVVLLGLVLSSAGLPRLPRVEGRAARGGALAWAAACATAIAGYHLAYKASLAAGGSPSAVFAVSLVVATAINIARLGAEGRRIAAAITRTRAPRVCLMGLLCGGSFLILMEALAAGGAGFVLTLRNTSVLFAVGLAWAIGDPPRRAQIAGAALVAAGATLMAW